MSTKKVKSPQSEQPPDEFSSNYPTREDWIENLFNYQPPETDEHKAGHKQINNACIQCALEIAKIVDHPEDLLKIFDALQAVRMTANAAYTRQRVPGLRYDLALGAMVSGKWNQPPETNEHKETGEF